MFNRLNKHMINCSICSSGKACYHLLQERSLHASKYKFITYLAYLLYAPLYISGPIMSFNAFASQVAGIETIENMPKCISNCYSLETFWKSWHASFNKWIVRYMYIPLGGSQKKLINVWIIFTFVALWHDLDWKLISWAWLTCVFLIPEIVIKASFVSFTSRSATSKLLLRELHAVAGAITITCLMVANLVGYVIGPSGTSWLISRLAKKDAFPVLGYMFFSFYVAVKLMFHISEAKQTTN